MKTRLSAMHRDQQGFSLIELMVALVLGLVIVGAAVGMFLSNQNASRATQGVSRIQENSRIGFELMARDIRDAGGTPCSKHIAVMNVLNSAAPGGDWRYNWGAGIEGFDSATTIPNLPSAGTTGAPVAENAIIIHSAADNGTTVSLHETSAASFTANTVNHGFLNGDIAIACDYRQGAIFQITNANPSTATLVHNTGGAHAPGNCVKKLGLTTLSGCGGSAGVGYAFQPNGTIAKLHSAAWYIGEGSTPGSRSLFRQVIDKSPEEIVNHVTSMQITYLERGETAYSGAAGVSDWGKVTAVRVQFTAQSPDDVGVGNVPIQRTVVNNIALRNRNA